MNALRSIFNSRALISLRNSQNALINLTQPVDAAVKPKSKSDNNDPACGETCPNPTLIPRSILDATFKDKKYAVNVLSSESISRNLCRERKIELVYLCKLCKMRNTKIVGHAAYNGGVVILQCDGCFVNHLIIDHLGWFANSNGFNEVLSEKGVRVRIIKVNEQGDLLNHSS